MPVFCELLEMPSSHLKVTGCIYILGAPTYGCLFLVEVCHAPEYIDIGRVMIKKSDT